MTISPAGWPKTTYGPGSKTPPLPQTRFAGGWVDRAPQDDTSFPGWKHPWQAFTALLRGQALLLRGPIFVARDGDPRKALGGVDGKGWSGHRVAQDILPVAPGLRVAQDILPHVTRWAIREQVSGADPVFPENPSARLLLLTSRRVEWPEANVPISRGKGPIITKHEKVSDIVVI